MPRDLAEVNVLESWIIRDRGCHRVALVLVLFLMRKLQDGEPRNAIRDAAADNRA
jgi:hypothetical protein